MFYGKLHCNEKKSGAFFLRTVKNREKLSSHIDFHGLLAEVEQGVHFFHFLIH